MGRQINTNLPFLDDDSVRADALEMLVCAKTSHVFFAGTSMNQAESFHEKMLKIGTIVSIPNNLNYQSNYQSYEADCLGPEDLALMISYSGETKSMVEIARYCHETGVPVLALTSVGDNAVASFAD